MRFLKLDIVLKMIMIFFVYLLSFQIGASAQMSTFYAAYNNYKYCDSTSYSIQTYIKNIDIQKTQYSNYFIELKRKKKGHHWYNYNIRHFDSTLNILSKFDAQEKRVIVYHNDVNYFKDSSYIFDAHSSPVYIWSIHGSPFEKEYLFNHFYKFSSDNGSESRFLSQNNAHTIYLYIDNKSKLITSVVTLKSDGSLDSVTFDYFYFKSKNKEAFLSQKSSLLFPLNPNQNKFLYNKLGIKITGSEKINGITSIDFGTCDYVLLDFWHIGCMPCRKVFPQLNTIVDSCKNVRVLSLNIHDDSIDVANFHDKYGYKFEMKCDIGLHWHNYFEISAYPSTLLIDRNFNVLFRHNGNFNSLAQEIIKNTLKK